MKAKKLKRVFSVWQTRVDDGSSSSILVRVCATEEVALKYKALYEAQVVGKPIRYGIDCHSVTEE